ncbi:hypothetical protein AWM70_18150 [Paenibacillus yonginensis]|uniref:Copper amine oxidase n=1 Tax=Paenibacillus yonginensis TaxID=1462996 RepID=A0A1B1N493_9BACL|nr:DUF4163 domain-containing protein [Paenibacillus yonginensis]ANS76268.1 hypothetical protein AWM70_18150 [Paenibacillus yonginensis]
MNRNQKWTGALLAAALLFGAGAGSAEFAAAASSKAAPAVQAPAAFNLKLNGKQLARKALAGQEGSLVPLAAIRDGLGLKVSYEPKTKTYQITRGNISVKLVPSGYGTVQTVINGAKSYTGYEWVNKQGYNYVSVHLLTDSLGYRAGWDNATKTVNLVPLQLNNMKVTVQTLSQSDKVTNIQIEYPVISGLTNAEVQQQINKRFKDWADAYLQDSLKRSKDLGPGPQGAKNEFDMNYLVTYNRNGYISFRMLNYDYTGGAHGMSGLEGITIRLSDGKQIELANLLKANPDYLKVVDKTVAAKLKKDPGYFGGFTTAGDKPDFYLKDDGIVVFFQLYEYLPYAAGFPEYYIPFSALLPNGASPFEEQ